MVSLDVTPINTDADGVYFNSWLRSGFSGSALVLSTVYYPDHVSIGFSSNITSAQETEINTFYQALTPTDGLDEIKEGLISKVLAQRELRLETIILAEYPASSGKQFGCSTENQDSWSKLATLDARGLVTYPFVVKTYNYKDSYGIVDSSDLTAIIGTVSEVVLAERALSESYIDLVLASTTEAEAEAAIAPYFE